MEPRKTWPATIALLTPRGRGAVATLRITGVIAARNAGVLNLIPFQAANRKALLDQSIDRIIFGRWGTEELGAEEVVVSRISPDVLEIHCHGGFVAADRILADVQGLGATLVGWDEQVRQWGGELERQCELALSKATTLRTASWLLSQESLWRQWIFDLQRTLKQDDWNSASASVSQVLTWRDFARHLIEPYRVVLTGKPNVGKSSLINALVGFQRSIVFDQPGTTRDAVTAETAWDGWPVLLVDTAGLRSNAEGLEASGIELARVQIADADLVLFVRDASTPDETEDDPYRTEVLRGSDSKLVTVVNKIDLAEAGKLFPSQLAGVSFQVSARTRAGLDALIEGLGQRLVPTLPAIDEVMPFSSDLVDWLHVLSELLERRLIVEVIDHLADL